MLAPQGTSKNVSQERLCFFIAEFSCKALYGQQKLGISFYNNFCSHHYFSTKSSVILDKQKFVKICQVYQEKECLFHFFSTKFSVILHRHPASKLKYILHKPYNKTVNSIRVQTTHTPFGLMSCFFPMNQTQHPDTCDRRLKIHMRPISPATHMHTCLNQCLEKLRSNLPLKWTSLQALITTFVTY